MQKPLLLLYGIIAYALALLSLVLSIAFVGNLALPNTIDAGRASDMGEALVVNILLLGLFAVQHSGMARQAFKRWLTSMLPQAAERSTYVLISALLLLLLIWQWRPMPEVVWSFTSGPAYMILTALFWLGWALAFASTFLIDHFNLFGLQQVLANWRQTVASPSLFKTPWLYKFVRHPLYSGLVLAFWAAPTMTVGHLLFAVMTTGYILIGIWLEERDLVRLFGDAYREYKMRVPMLIPWLGGKK